MTKPTVAAARQLPAALQWTAPGRAIVFVLAAASIWCLLSEMYGLCDMGTLTFAILIPSTIVLYGLAMLDWRRGDGRLGRAVVIGTLAGLAGAIAYDVFRSPFVYSDLWGMNRWGIPQMPLFKVFPRFGAMILGEPREQASYSLADQLVGWTYHFSNGATFGVMFAALAAGAREAIDAAAGVRWRPIAGAVAMAVGIEICLLASPYARFFDIQVTPRFVVVTLTAHLIFGVFMGFYFTWHAGRWRLPSLPNAAPV